MTTTITLKTHEWPVVVTLSDNHHFSSPERRWCGWGETTEFVPRNTARDFHISNTRSISFRELPADATGLDEPDLPTTLAGSVGNAVGLASDNTAAAVDD